MKKRLLTLFKALAIGGGIAYATVWILFLGFIAYVACANVYSKYIHNWGTACSAFNGTDILSPSKQWIARRQEVGCSTLAGGLSIEVVLVRPHPLFSFLAPEHLVFARELYGNDKIPLDVQWKDDRNLMLNTAPCNSDTCTTRTSVEGVTITIAPPK